MKTFKEFLEDAYLLEMRKEDKVKGKKKTPLYITPPKAPLVKTPEGNWEKIKRANPEVSQMRPRQGMTTMPGDAPHPGWGSSREARKRHEHGGGGWGAKDGKPGELRGQKKKPGAKRERDWQTEGPSPAEKVEWKKSARANKGKDVFNKKTTL